MRFTQLSSSYVEINGDRFTICYIIHYTFKVKLKHLSALILLELCGGYIKCENAKSLRRERLYNYDKMLVMRNVIIQLTALNVKPQRGEAIHRV